MFYGPVADLLNYAHLCFFCKFGPTFMYQPIPPLTLRFPTIRKALIYLVFLFTQLPLVRGHCQSLHLLSVFLWKVYFVLISENKTQPFSWCKFYIKKMVNIIFVLFFSLPLPSEIHSNEIVVFIWQLWVGWGGVE